MCATTGPLTACVVIGGDLVSHRDKAGAVKSVSWNAAHSAAVASTTRR